jgi:3'-phosphoadenosine 5'-phosphosulfate sulfotransferase (PAPS reductase)/FAD synthetase
MHVSKSIQFLRSISNEKVYNKVAFALNGGKDSLVAFHLVKRAQVPVSTWFFWDKDEFVEVKRTIDELCKENSIDLIVLSSETFKDMKSVLSHLKVNFHIDACIEGHRATDASQFKSHETPENEIDLKPIPTDEGWPSVDRILPILNWSYKDVWQYIADQQVPFVPPLYKKCGYTSLGSKQSTYPNYLLWDNKALCYKHAQELPIESAERVGRLRNGFCLPFEISGSVIHGKGQGKQLGFATANLDCTCDRTQHGVYGATATLGQNDMLAVCSVGPNVTFGEKSSSFEVHLIDDHGAPLSMDDFYGETLHVTLMFFLRPMVKFDNIDDLKKQIKEDIQRFIYHYRL